MKAFHPPRHSAYRPPVSCAIICYKESHGIIQLLKSLHQQLYPGFIEILVIIDDAVTNSDTVYYAREFQQQYPDNPRRRTRIIRKSSRGGRSSSENIALKLAQGELIIVLDGDCSCDNNMVDMAAQRFINPNTVAVSGSLRVRNAEQNILTRLQALEYMFGIQLFRTGLSKANVINNVSGAFGIFRTRFLRRIGGWNNGAGEDLDLTMRMKAYFRRYPHLKIRHDHYAIVHTDVPNTWTAFFKQRLRWDGDLYYVYCIRHWSLFKPQVIGWANFIFVSWYGLLFQIILPFVIVISLIYLFSTFTVAYVMSLIILTYSYYLIITIVSYTLYLLLVSDRKGDDAYLIPFLILMPVYQFVTRIWSVFATISEIILRSHRDTNMAPYWVNKKSNR